MYLWSLITPLFGIIIIFIFGRFLGKNGVISIALISLFLAWLTSLFVFFEVVFKNQVCSIKLFNWFSLGLLSVDAGVLFDFVTATMLLVILTISILVNIYSINYLGEDPFFIRFYLYLLIFTFFMLLLVTADNFIQMFFGWEGVGVASYLLINFWYTRLEANKAALKAMIVNRIGDVGIYIALILLFTTFKSFSYYTLFELTYYISQETFYFFPEVDNFLIVNSCFEINKISLIVIFLFLGAMSKSAQIGLHTWLPDAMEGPTPVSALLHAATMVTAGVFILVRLSPIIEYASDVLFIITFFGAITAFFTATIGVVQNDLKKVIAYSTCSQLGYMVFVCGLSGYSAALFHLFNHAFFKALLFLGAGSVIHTLLDEQDMRKMGGILKFIPVTYISILIGSLALTGFPFLSGYYSKDLILEFSLATYELTGLFSYWFGTLAAFFTSYYSIRLLYLTFLRKYNGPSTVLKTVHESSNWILGPLFILVILSVLSGYIFHDLYAGLGVNSWVNSILIMKSHNVLLDSEFILAYLKLIPTVFSLIGCFLSFFVYTKMKIFVNIFPFYFLNKLIRSFLVNKWYFDIFYNKYIVKYFFFLNYYIFYKMVDRGFMEFFGPVGVTLFFNKLMLGLKRVYTGSLNYYVFFMLLCFHVILIVSLDSFSFFQNIEKNYDFLIFMFIYIFYFIMSFKTNKQFYFKNILILKVLLLLLTLIILLNFFPFFMGETNFYCTFPKGWELPKGVRMHPEFMRSVNMVRPPDFDTNRFWVNYLKVSKELEKEFVDNGIFPSELYAYLQKFPVEEYVLGTPAEVAFYKELCEKISPQWVFMSYYVAWTTESIVQSVRYPIGIIPQLQWEIGEDMEYIHIYDLKITSDVTCKFTFFGNLEGSTVAPVVDETVGERMFRDYNITREQFRDEFYAVDRRAYSRLVIYSMVAEHMLEAFIYLENEIAGDPRNVYRLTNYFILMGGEHFEDPIGHCPHIKLESVVLNNNFWRFYLRHPGESFIAWAASDYVYD